MDKYQASLEYLYSFVDYETVRQPGISQSYDLRRVEELLERMGNPHHVAPCVHIAGTKGKGSTAAMIDSVLTTSGYSTGLYTSPHLIDIRERIRVKGKPITRVEFVSCIEWLKREVAVVNARTDYGRLTMFEILTALSFLFFAKQKVDFQVVEVGLGGRLDATNVVNPEVCAITTLGMDHTDILGDTLAKIAAEKAGIIKQRVPLVSALQKPEAANVIEEFCRRHGAMLIRAGVDITCNSLSERLGVQRLEINGRRGRYQVELPLYGHFQQENVVVAVGVLEMLAERGYRITAKSIVTGLRHVRWRGRFQIIRQRPLVVTDGAHNLQSIQALRIAVENLLKDESRCKRVLVIGVSSDKDYAAIAYELEGLFDVAIITQSHHARALATDVLAKAFIGTTETVIVAPSVPAALDEAIKLGGKEAFICATGSLYIVGEALQWAHKRGY